MIAPPTRVWSGIAGSVQLQFPDQATAQSVLAGLWADSGGILGGRTLEKKP